MTGTLEISRPNIRATRHTAVSARPFLAVRGGLATDNVAAGGMGTLPSLGYRAIFRGIWFFIRDKFSRDKGTESDN